MAANILSRLIGRVRSLFIGSTDIEKQFGVELIRSSDMAKAIKLWHKAVQGKPPWLNADDEITTVNMARHVADTRAQLATLDIGISISGSARADYLQSVADELLRQLPTKLCSADALGGMIIKYNGVSWDYVMPQDFGVTAQNYDGDITGAIFSVYASQNGAKYVRLEHHRFEGDGESRKYVISHKAFKYQINVKNGEVELGAEVPLGSVESWSSLDREVQISNLQRPLFAYYRVPGNNVVDAASPLGVSVFAGAITELKAIDVAISRKNAEVEDSKHITFVGQQAIQYANNKGITLPRFIKGLGIGIDDDDNAAIKEHVPTLLTDARVKDINFDLSLLSVKCGFSAGAFVLDGQSGMMTATQVEADDRDTIQTIKSERDALKAAIEQAIEGADALATLRGTAPEGEYEINFNFGDITYSYEEDKASWKQYVLQGWMPKWMYFVKFEGMSEEDAKRFTAEAAQSGTSDGLFAD